MQSELPPGSSAALLRGGSGAWGGSSSLPREPTLSLISAQIKQLVAKGASSRAVAVGKFGWSWQHIQSSTFPVVCADAEIRAGWSSWAGASASMGTGWAAPGIPQLLPVFSRHPSPHPQSRALPQRGPKPLLTQRNNKCKGYFPTHVSLHRFFSASARFFRKHKAFCFFLVQKEASFFHFENDLCRNEVVPLLFCCPTWTEALFLSLLRKTDKMAEDGGALPVPEQEQ